MKVLFLITCNIANLDDSENDDDGDDDADDGDDDESSGARTTSIVGAVIGSMLAIALIGCAIFLITKCTRRNRTRGLPVGGDSVTVHFWSKDRLVGHRDLIIPHLHGSTMIKHGLVLAKSY